MLIAVARVRSSHGIKGFIKASALSGHPDTVKAQKELRIGANEDSAVIFKLEGVRPTTADSMLIKLEGIDSMDEAEQLKGMTIYIPEEALPALPQLTYYSYQLEGCLAYFEDGSLLGAVKRVDSFPANDVLVVETTDGIEVLVPATKDIIKAVDLDSRRITIENRKGLV